MDRYRSFKFLNSPIYFDELFKDKSYEVVQIHDATPIKDMDGIVGFCGIVSWRDNVLKPLDGDSYTCHMPVIAYEEFEFDNGTKGLDILVTEW